MTTTAFRMDLMLPAMGIKRFRSHSRTPTTISTATRLIRGMIDSLLSSHVDTRTCPKRALFPCSSERLCDKCGAEGNLEFLGVQAEAGGLPTRFALSASSTRDIIGDPGADICPVTD